MIKLNKFIDQLTPKVSGATEQVEMEAVAISNIEPIGYRMSFITCLDGSSAFVLNSKRDIVEQCEAGLWEIVGEDMSALWPDPEQCESAPEEAPGTDWPDP